MCSVRHIIGAGTWDQKGQGTISTVTMSISLLKGNRTRYRNLLEKELGKAKFHEDDREGEIKVLIKIVNNCINRLNVFQQKLEDTGLSMSTVIDGQEGEDEILELIKDDWDYISTVMDCRDELINLKSSLQEQGSPKGKSSSVTVTDERFNQMAQLKAQLQQILLGQQQLRHQQITMTQSNNGQVAVKLEDKYWDTPTEVTSPVTNLTCTRLGGDLSLGGGPRPGRKRSKARCRPKSRRGSYARKRSNSRKRSKAGWRS